MTMEDPAHILTLKPSEAMAALRACFLVRENVGLISAPGMGKSSIKAQVAAEMGYEYIASHPSLEDQTEPGGLPWFAEDHSHAKKLPFGQVWKVLRATKPTVWDLEDFGMAPDSVQKGYIQWSEAREVDGNRLPDCVSITMSTNRRGDKAGVSGVLEPIKGRFTLLHLKSDLHDWMMDLFDRGTSHYGLTEEAIEFGSFHLQNHPDELNMFKPGADMTNTPTERNWVRAFRHIQHGLDRHIELALVAGRVGVGAAVSFMATVDLLRKQKAFSIDAILANPDKAPIPDDMSSLWCIAIGLASKATAPNFDRVSTYLERMERAQHGEMTALCVKDAIHKSPRITATQAYIRLMHDTPVGALVQGKYGDLENN